MHPEGLYTHASAGEVLNELEVLFIDEVSMLSAELLQCLDLHISQASMHARTQI